MNTGGSAWLSPYDFQPAFLVVVLEVLHGCFLSGGGPAKDALIEIAGLQVRSAAFPSQRQPSASCQARWRIVVELRAARGDLRHKVRTSDSFAMNVGYMAAATGFLHLGKR
jgi:hypothetical protein